MPISKPGVTPTTIKTFAADDDFVIMLGADGNDYKITKADLFAGLGSTSSPSNTNLTFSSIGDVNGICYWLATRNNSSWANPHLTGKLVVSSNGVAAGNLANIVDRTPGSSNYTVNAANSFWGIDLITHKLKPTHYTIRHDINQGYYLRSWIFQGSQDGVNWTNIDLQNNNTQIGSPHGWVSVAVTSNTAYKHLRILMTGTNSSGTYEFCCSELEFYGEVQAL